MKPLIPKDRAADIVAFRIAQKSDPALAVLPTLEEFGESLLDLGYVETRVSKETLRRLLDGKMYPELKDPASGKAFAWEDVPQAVRGKRSKVNLVHQLRLQIEALTARVQALEDSRGEPLRNH